MTIQYDITRKRTLNMTLQENDLLICNYKARLIHITSLQFSLLQFKFFILIIK